VRISVAVIRLPDWRDYSQHSQLHQQATLDYALAELRQRQHAVEQRQHVVEHGHLPALQQALAESQQTFAAQQLALVEQMLTETHRDGKDNLLKSVPASLRKLAAELNAVRGTLSTVSGTADYLLGRTEFVRRELMFEMRHGARPAGAAGDALQAEPHIADPDRLAQARQGQLKLNLGCGHLPLADYINVDRRPLPGVDVVAEADALPFGADEVDEISSAHLLEHFPQEHLRRRLLPHFFALLKPGGRLHAVVPDAEAMMAAYAAGGYPYADLREVMFGAQDYDGDYHFNMFTPASLTALLEEAGFTDVALLHAGRRNGRCFEFEISAGKPA
jgi:predicted SAM-dependent methyltransferase